MPFKENINMPLVSREGEQKLCRSFLNNFIISHKSSVIIIDGESGTGKTFFTKKIIGEFLRQNTDIFNIYLDINDDEFTTNIFFESLIYLSWNPYLINEISINNIPSNKSFFNFLKTLKIKKKILEKLYSTLVSTIELLPSYGKSLKEIIPRPYEKDDIDPSPDIATLYIKYLKHITKDKFAILIIDNYQYLTLNIQNLFLSHAINIEKNLLLIIINRTSDENEKTKFTNYHLSDQIHLLMKPFTYLEILNLSKSIFKDAHLDVEQVSKDCFLKTNGNLKEIEYYLNSLKMRIGKGSLDINVGYFIDTIQSLPMIQKNLLAITALFPAGLKIDYVIDIVKYIVLMNEEEVEDLIGEMIGMGYLVLNSENGKLLRPAHEKIVRTIRKGFTEEEFIELQKNISVAFEQLLNKSLNRLDYAYLLHCFIGILNTNQFIQKINYVINLIDIQYQKNLYNYIVTIYNSYPDLILYLPDHIIFYVLDAFQKTSEFYLGMSALKKLEMHHSSTNIKFKIYYAKYLTQTYKFIEAFEILESLDYSEEVTLYKMNILQHLCKDEDAIELMGNYFTKHSGTETYYIILRNTAHYFSYTEAVTNLTKVIIYFENKGHLFGKATGYNNLGVIHLWNNNIIEAKKMFEKALKIFDNIHSNEIFEPLCNMGVIKLLENEHDEADRYFISSLNVLPKSLFLDYIILMNNILINKLDWDKININDGIEEFLKLHEQVNTFQDPSVKFLITFNLNTLLLFTGRNKKEDYDNDILKKTTERNRTYFEIYKTIQVDNSALKCILSLSPHWRY